MHLATSVERLDNHRVALEIEVPPETVEAALDRAYRRLVARANIPGFRKGKAPRPIFERYVGRAALWDEAIDGIVGEALMQAIREADLEPIDRPTIDLRSTPDSKVVQFRAELAVRPDVALGDYRAIRVPLEVAEVDEKAVDEAMEKLRASRAVLEPVDEPRPLEKGDVAIIDIRGLRADGSPVDGWSVHDFIVEVGSGQIHPEIDEGIVGMMPDETRNLAVTLPEDDPGEPPVESPATFDVTLKEIKTRRLPELDDEFAKGFGEFSSLEGMRESVRNTLAERARAQAREAAANEALRQLRETARVDLPEMLVARREESLRETWDRRVAESGRSREEWLAEAGQSEEEWAEALRRQAELDVKTELVLSALAKAEGIVPSEEDVRQEVERIAQSYGRENAARVRRLILNDPDEMADIRERLRYRSAIDLLARIASGEADEAAGTSDSAPADGEADE